jgi:hypothetical protein
MLSTVANLLRLWAGIAIAYGIIQWSVPGGQQDELLGLIGFLIATIAFGCSWIIDGLENIRKTLKENEDEPKEPRRVINLR